MRIIIGFGKTTSLSLTLKKKIVIAIDGPAASGKSTTARRLAQKLGYIYVDTGAMYRAITLKAIKQQVLPRLQTDDSYLKSFLDATDIRLSESCVWLDGQDVSDEIRNNDVSKSVSKVSSFRAVREKLSIIQKEMGKVKGIVMDGRDIGTAIFPEAELKIYMVASAQERAKRRFDELKRQNSNLEVSIEELEREIMKRDEEDMNRALSPLRKADDAVTLDTSQISIEEQVERIYALAVEKIET